jgi:hypothetical protein
VRAAERLDREVIDEMTVAGTRYRVVCAASSSARPGRPGAAAFHRP